MSFTLISDDGVYEEEFGFTGGPDYNLGKEYSKTFTWKNEETGTFATAVATYYVNARDEETNEDLDWGEYQEALKDEEKSIRFFVSEQTETVTHTTEDDPFSWNSPNYEYGEGSMFFYDTLEETEQTAKAMAERESAEFYSPEFF